MKNDFWLKKEIELSNANKISRVGKRDRIEHPLETAQQKAAKRAKKLLDFKRQQEVEKIAAEKLGSHEKKCPICEHPFKDVNEFMAHLSKCNVVESSEEEPPLDNVQRDQSSAKDQKEGIREIDPTNSMVKEELRDENVNLSGLADKKVKVRDNC